MSDYQEQLLKLKSLYELTGGLHQGIVDHLQMWPFVVDPTLEATGGSKCIVDLETQNIRYEWQGSTLKVDAKYKNRLKELDKAIKFILGKSWQIQVLLNSNSIYPIDGRSQSRTNPSRNSRKRPSKGSKRTNSRRK